MKFTTDEERLAEYRRLVEGYYILLTESDKAIVRQPRNNDAFDRLIGECRDAASQVAGAERALGMEEPDIKRERWPLRVKYHIGDQDRENDPAGK